MTFIKAFLYSFWISFGLWAGEVIPRLIVMAAMFAALYFYLSGRPGIPF